MGLFGPSPNISETPREKGEVITDRWSDTNGIEFGRETAIRARTKDICLRQLDSETNYLQRQYQSHENYHVLERINVLNDKRAQLAQDHGHWASTNTPRLLFEKGKEKAKRTDLPVLGNLRVYRLEFTDGTSTTFNGSAAVSDFVHAETSLMEIRDYLRISDQRNLNSLSEAEKQHFKEFYNFDVSRPDQYFPVLQNMQNHIYLAYGTSAVNKVVQIEFERKDLLRKQVLQDMYQHFLNNPVSYPYVTYSRTALLDTTKKPVTDSTGYHLNEKNQLMDMKAIYDDLQGAPVCFDLKDTEGPFFDMHGVIHMPKNCCTEQFWQSYPYANVYPLLFNISVQGNTVNAAPQYWVNMAALAKLERLPMNEDQRTRFMAIRQKLRIESQTDFALAQEVFSLLRELGYCSIDCYGGKDRTGYAIALDVFRTISKKLEQKTDPSLRAALEQRLAEIALQLVDTGGVLVGVVEDNTGHTVVKLSKVDLDLYFKGTGIQWLLGASKRMFDLIQASTLYVADKVGDKTIPSKRGVMHGRDLPPKRR